MNKILLLTITCILNVIIVNAQFSIQRNPTDNTAVDILYKADAIGQGNHIISYFQFAIQIENPDGNSLTATFTPAVPLASLASFQEYTGQDYGSTTFAWASNTPATSTTYNFPSTEVVLGTVTFSNDISSITISAIDYQNQLPYGGASDNGVWVLGINNPAEDATDYANLFYQSSGSNAPYTTNDGGVINQKVDVIPGAPLPIALSDFTAQLNNKHTVDLDWVTQTEVNSKGFDIERSSNGRDFQKIAFVSSKAIDGNSTAKLVYASEDLNPVTGDNYYRLKEISMDGKATYSVVRKVIVPGNKQLISLYPNPANSFVNIKGLQEGNMIRVYDMTGKMILEKKAAESQLMQIDVSGIANGNYQIAVFNNDERVFIGKLVKHD